MIVCHCNVLSDDDIKTATHHCRGADGMGLATPGKVFAHHGKRPGCGNCMPSMAQIINDALAQGNEPAQLKNEPAQLKNEPAQLKRERRHTTIIQTVAGSGGIDVQYTDIRKNQSRRTG